MKLGRLSIDVPNDWEDQSVYAFVAPPKKAEKGLVARAEMFRSNMVITLARADQATLEARVAAAEERVRKRWGQIPIETADGPAIRGRPTRRLRYRIIDQGAPIAQAQYVVLWGETEIVLTFTSSTSAPKSELEQFDGLVRSLVLE